MGDLVAERHDDHSLHDGHNTEVPTVVPAMPGTPGPGGRTDDGAASSGGVLPPHRRGQDTPPVSGEDQPRSAKRPASIISVLGRFEVRCDGEIVSVPPGLPTDAIKFVAVHGGRVRTEVLIDALWPDATDAEGRKGVRNVMSRLARGGCAVLERDGATIRVGHDVRIDAVAFQTIADRVLFNVRHPGATDGARLALDHYVGDLLPDDPYLEWTSALRDALRRRRLALVDLLASDARRRGAKREAMTLMELAIEIEPFDDLRYLEVAEMLLEAGRRGRAAVYVHRSLQVLREYGLKPGPDWAALYRQIQDAAPEAGGPSGRAPVEAASYPSTYDPTVAPPQPTPGPGPVALRPDDR